MLPREIFRGTGKRDPGLPCGGFRGVVSYLGWGCVGGFAEKWLRLEDPGAQYGMGVLFWLWLSD